MNLKKCTLFFLTIILSSFEVAHAKTTNNKSIDCNQIERDGGTNYEMGQCADMARAEANLELNNLYRRLIQEFKGSEGEKSLIEAQSAWIVWREKESKLCARVSGFSPLGSSYGMVKNLCDSAMTKERSKSISVYLQDLKNL